MADQIIPEKTCTKCNIPQPISNFHRAKHGKYGVTAQCKACVHLYTISPKRRARHYEIHVAWKQRQGQNLKEHTRAYYLANRDKILKRACDWQRDNKDHRRSYLRGYYQDHKATIIAATKAWGKAHPKHLLIHAHRRRGRKVGAAGDFTLKQWLAKCEYHGWRCYICSKPLTVSDLTIDHRIPLAHGGSNWAANLAPACNACNAGKANSAEAEYRARRSRKLDQCNRPLLVP